MKYTALDESLVFLPRAIFATRLSSQAVYFIQTGGSALSNTYKTYRNNLGRKIDTSIAVSAKIFLYKRTFGLT